MRVKGSLGWLETGEVGLTKRVTARAPDVQGLPPFSPKYTPQEPRREWGCLWWEREAEDLLSPEPWSSGRVRSDPPDWDSV